MRLPPVVSVLMVGLSYGASNVLLLTYTRCMMKNFLAFRDSPIISKTLTSEKIIETCRDGNRQHLDLTTAHPPQVKHDDRPATVHTPPPRNDDGLAV